MLQSRVLSRCGVTANMPALGAGDSGFESLHLDTAFWRYGDYGVTVNTRVCGSRNSGSIPDSPPKRNNKTMIFSWFCCFKFITSSGNSVN